MSEFHRMVVLDTETTGLDPKDGHRIIEIGAVVIVNRKIENEKFHVYLNPERDIDQRALQVHGLTRSFLSQKPKFKDIAEDLKTFLHSSTLVIHNAAFDLGFLEAEFARLGFLYEMRSEHHIIDTLLDLARKRHPGQKNNLDALCKRYGIDNQDRALHGAYKDALLLAKLYLAMTGGQGEFNWVSANEQATAINFSDFKIVPISRQPGETLKVILADPEEVARHDAFLRNDSNSS